MKAVECLQRLGLVKAVNGNVVAIDKWIWVRHMAERRRKRKAKPVTILQIEKKLMKLGYDVLVV